MTKAKRPSQVSACIFNQHDGHECMSLYIEKKTCLCALSMYQTYDFTLNKRRRIGFYTLWKDTVCMYHYFTIGYMHIKCDFNLNKRRRIGFYTLWYGMYISFFHTRIYAHFILYNTKENYRCMFHRK